MLVSAVQWNNQLKYTYIPCLLSLPPALTPPPQFNTERWAELPVQYSRFLPPICFTYGKCIHSVSRCGKLSSGHRTGNGQFLFQSQRKAMPKNAQTTAQLHSSHTLVKQYSKFSKPGFNNTWTVNFQMLKLDLEKAEEPEIKLPTSTGSLKKQESSRKMFTSALLTMPKPLTVWITTNWKILKEMGIPDHLTCLLRNLYADQEAIVKTGHRTTD